MDSGAIKEATGLAVIAAGLPLWADSLRRIWRVGRTWNDHMVAGVASMAFGWYLLPQWQTEQQTELWPTDPWAGGLRLWAVASMWAMFRALGANRQTDPLERALLLWPSQVAFAFAFWGLPLIGVWIAAGPGPWLALPLGLALWGTAHTRLTGNRVRRIAVPGLPIRIAHLSDIHAGGLMHRAEIAALVRDVNAGAPDLVLITGDQLMPFSEADHGWLLDELKRLRAPVRMCAGNHDLPVLAQLQAECAAAGMPMLVDAQEILEIRPGASASAGAGAGADAGVNSVSVRIELTGVNFYWKKPGDRLTELLARLPPPPPDACRILLAHDPRAGLRAPPDRFDLVLSGHTHGGQLGLNMFGWPVSLLRIFGWRDQGIFVSEPDSPRPTRHFVHSGNWWMAMPPRMGVAPEVVFLEGTATA